MPEPLTELERRILDYMVDYLRSRTYQPSIREIGREFDIRSTKTVSEYLQALANKGWIERDPSRSRGVHLLGVDLASVGEGDRYPSVEGIAAMKAGGRLRLAAPKAPAGAAKALTFEASVAGAPDVGVRQGDVIYVEPLSGDNGDAYGDGDVLAVRYGRAVGVGRCRRREGAALALEWAEGPALALRPRLDPAVTVLGRAVGIWRPIPTCQGVEPEAGAAESRGRAGRGHGSLKPEPSR